MIDAWKGFFAQFPDYRNVFGTVEVRDGRVAEWCVHDDTPATRERLGIA